MRWWLQETVGLSTKGYILQQTCGLVNVKLKWVKDKELDSVVSGERHLRAVCNLVSVISSATLPIFHISRHRRHLGLRPHLKLASFIRRYPNIFVEHCYRDSAGTRVPSFALSPEALHLHHQEADVVRLNKEDLLARLCKLLMLTRDRALPLHFIDHLRWDLGLPYDYQHSLIPNHPHLFSLLNLSTSLVLLKLLHWDERLAVSHLQLQQGLGCDHHLPFPVKFTRGFGLKRKTMEWLQEWQTLPYTSPYVDASHLDPRTDLSEKRIVGVFHELLHLTIGKKMERQNVSNLRKPFALPHKFTKVFERHPGIFYISMKSDTQTVILREAYEKRHLLEKHPLMEIREKFANMMIQGFLDKSRGLYRKFVDDDSRKLTTKINNPVWTEEDDQPDRISGYDYH